MLPFIDLLYDNVTKLYFRDSDTDSQSGTATVTIPASTHTGDIIIFGHRARNSAGTPSANIPSGFTQIGTTLSLNQTTVAWSRKLAIGTDAGTNITVDQGTSQNRAIILVFRPNGHVTSINVADVAGGITLGNPVAQTVNASGGAVPLVVLALYATLGGTVDPRTFSPAEDAEIEIGTNTLFFMKYKIYNSSPQDTTVDMDDEGGDNVLASCYIEAT